MDLYLKNTILYKRTKEIIALNSKEFTDYFYPELLHTHSDLARSFRNTDLPKQKEKLIEGLGKIFQLLGNETELTRYLHDLSVRHLCYEVNEEHYPIVKDVFLKSVKQIHQTEWNQEYENWWTALLTLITNNMITVCRQIREAS